MKRAITVAAASLLLLFALSGCGSRMAPDPPGSDVASATQQPAGTPSEAPAVVQSEEAPPPASGEATAPAQAQGARAPATPTPDYGPKHNNGTVRIELSATCVSPGDVLVITIIGPAKAGLGMVIGYSDHQPHGAMLTGETDANGRYVWRVPVDPTVPDGQATVLVTATGPDWEQEGGGTADAKFDVARGGC